jgi:dienelactone hydrolase
MRFNRLALAVVDVRSLAAWLRQDHPVVGITGGRLGGFVTLAVAAAEPKLDFAVAWVPPSSLGGPPAATSSTSSSNNRAGSRPSF